jgi:hypothetical protein
MTELVRKSASSSNGGELDSSAAQTIPGDKTFSGALTLNGAITANSTLRVGTRFTKYKNESGNITSTQQTSTVDVGTLSANLSYIDIPRTGIYRIFICCGGTGTTTLSNGIRVIIHIRKAASGGSFASASQIGSRGFNQSQNGGGGSTNRPYAMASAEYIGSLTANDRVYFALDYYDNPNNTGVLGGGTLEAGTFIVEELSANSMS